MRHPLTVIGYTALFTVAIVVLMGLYAAPTTLACLAWGMC